MNEMKTLILTIAVVAAVAVPRSLQAQGCLECVDDTYLVKHTAYYPEYWVLMGWYGPLHLQWYDGYCLFNHQAGCSDYEQDEEELIEQLETSDGADLLELLATRRGRVRFSDQMRGFEILDCSGDVRRIVPASAGQMSVLATTTPLPNTSS